jgi:hypothetical protein
MCCSDQFGGFRSIAGTRLALAVSKSNRWDEGKRYGVPDGYVPCPWSVLWTCTFLLSLTQLGLCIVGHGFQIPLGHHQ